MSILDYILSIVAVVITVSVVAMPIAGYFIFKQFMKSKREFDDMQKRIQERIRLKGRVTKHRIEL